MSNEDRSALYNSETYQELERAERRRQLQKMAQTLSDKIVQSPTAQKAITDGITKALENKDDDGAMGAHEDLKKVIHKLTDHELFEMSKMFSEELELRGIDADKYEEEFEDEEEDETEKDELVEEGDMEDVFAFVKSSLTKLAYDSANNGDTEACYLIERCIQKLV